MKRLQNGEKINDTNNSKWRTNRFNSNMFKFKGHRNKNAVNNKLIEYGKIGNVEATASYFQKIISNSFGTRFHEKQPIKKNIVILSNGSSILILDNNFPQLFNNEKKINNAQKINNEKNIKGFASTSLLHYLVIPRLHLIYNIISISKRHTDLIINMCELATRQIELTNNMTLDVYRNVFNITNIQKAINSNNRLKAKEKSIKNTFKTALNAF